MSRRGAEFQHRTSVFEGAYRAWSHLGGLNPQELQTVPVQELNPLVYTIDNDPRILLSGATTISSSSVTTSMNNNSTNNKSSGSFSDNDTATMKTSTTGKDLHDTTSLSGTGPNQREYPYEPLPRCGLAHPFVQSILNPWLGPEVDPEGIKLGLDTLRTWWQHRRKGQNSSAVKALSTTKMQVAVDEYTKHFFQIAHCLITTDREQAPKGLQVRIQKYEKETGTIFGRSNNTSSSGGNGGGNTCPNSSSRPQQQQQQPDNAGTKSSSSLSLGAIGEGGGGGDEEDDGETSTTTTTTAAATPTPINMKGRCVPGKLNLPELVNQVQHRAIQMTHRGTGKGGGGSGSGSVGGKNSSSSSSGTNKQQQQQPDETVSTTNKNSATSASVVGGPGSSNSVDPQQPLSASLAQYGNPTTLPVVYWSSNGDIQIAMRVEGITCAHCIKIVETVLKGCSGQKSPIDGLLDAASDQDLNGVLIQIDKSLNAKRIAYEAKRNLSLVGYRATTIELDCTTITTTLDNKTTATILKQKQQQQQQQHDNKKQQQDTGDKNHDPNHLLSDEMILKILRTYETFAMNSPNLLDWTAPCTCPDGGVYPRNCPRHNQMHTGLFDHVMLRRQQVIEYLSGHDLKTTTPIIIPPILHNNHNTNLDIACLNQGSYYQQQQQQQQPQLSQHSQLRQHHQHVPTLAPANRLYESMISTGSTPFDEEEPLTVEQEMNLQLMRDTEPLPLGPYPVETSAYEMSQSSNLLQGQNVTTQYVNEQIMGNQEYLMQQQQQQQAQHQQQHQMQQSVYPNVALGGYGGLDSNFLNRMSGNEMNYGLSSSSTGNTGNSISNNMMNSTGNSNDLHMMQLLQQRRQHSIGLVTGMGSGYRATSISALAAEFGGNGSEDFLWDSTSMNHHTHVNNLMNNNNNNNNSIDPSSAASIAYSNNGGVGGGNSSVNDMSSSWNT